MFAVNVNRLSQRALGKIRHLDASQGALARKPEPQQTEEVLAVLAKSSTEFFFTYPEFEKAQL